MVMKNIDKHKNMLSKAKSFEAMSPKTSEANYGNLNDVVQLAC